MSDWCSQMFSLFPREATTAADPVPRLLRGDPVRASLKGGACFFFHRRRRVGPDDGSGSDLRVPARCDKNESCP